MVDLGIYIHQALFGYREGHRLLQASRTFIPATERALLILTDLSGPRMVNGFEEYISGYPIPGEDVYALTKTWYAPEMKRPGCVWSHVLLIRTEDLAQIADAAALIPLFRDPRTTGPKHYIGPAKFVGGSASQAVRGIIADTEALITSLYEEPQKSAIIPAENTGFYEAVILEAWSQQWPALRAAFRFCTGSLSNRTIGGQPFDLQVVPISLWHELQRRPNAFAFLIPDRNYDDIPERLPWITLGAGDLIKQLEGTSFRKFLWKYADPCGGQRSLYAKLAELFLVLQYHDAYNPDITQRVSSIFPEMTCGTALKQDLYGNAADSGSLPRFPNEIARLTELATTPFWSSFDASRLDLRARGHKLWNQEKNEAKNLLLNLLQKPTQGLADMIIAGFVEAMSPSEACQLAQANSGLLLALVSRNPHLVVADGFWQCKLPLQAYYDLFDFLQTNEAVEQLPPRIWILSALQSDTDELAGAIVERFGREAVLACLERIKTGKDHWIPSVAWRTAMSTHQNELIDCLKGDCGRSSRAMTLLAGLLDAHHPGLTAFGIGPWLRLAREASELVREFPGADSAAFLLSLGFQHSEPEATELVTLSFETVHAAAADDSLSYRGWRILEDELPALSWWMRAWDRCERLRQAMLQRFIRHRWPQQAFLQCVSKPETVLRVLYSSREVLGGEDFVRSVAEQVFTGALNATKEQHEIFDASFRRNWDGELRLNL